MEQRNEGVQFVLGLSLGLVAGVVATILLTPQAGRRTREELKSTTLQEADTVTERIMRILEEEAERLARRIGDELLEVGRAFFERQQSELRAGLDGNSGQDYQYRQT